MEAGQAAREAGKGSEAPVGAEQGEGSWRTREGAIQAGVRRDDKAAWREGLRGAGGQADPQQRQG